MTQTQEREATPYRVRRQRRSTIVVIVVLLALAGAFYYASTYFRDTTPQAVPCTTVVPAPVLKPIDVTLNVYNATTRKGLASSTAKIVRERGFKVKAVANDPKKASIKQSAQIRFGPSGAASARLVQSRVAGAVLVNDKRADDSVDLVLGNGFKAIRAESPAATATSGAPICPTVTP